MNTNKDVHEKKNERVVDIRDQLGGVLGVTGLMVVSYGLGQERARHASNIVTEFQETLIDVISNSPDAQMTLGWGLYLCGMAILASKYVIKPQ